MQLSFGPSTHTHTTTYNRTKCKRTVPSRVCVFTLSLPVCSNCATTSLFPFLQAYNNGACVEMRCVCVCVLRLRRCWCCVLVLAFVVLVCWCWCLCLVYKKGGTHKYEGAHAPILCHRQGSELCTRHHQGANTAPHLCRLWQQPRTVVCVHAAVRGLRVRVCARTPHSMVPTHLLCVCVCVCVGWICPRV